MHGEHELECLNRVRGEVFCKDDQPIQNPITHNSYLDVSDDEFEKNRILYVNSDYCRCCFGMLKHDYDELESVLRAAYSNPDVSCFPDFLFKNGFIEHFQVTSSLETKKGSTHVKQEREFYRTVNTEIKRIESEWDKAPSFDVGRSKSWLNPNSRHSHQYLMNSFKNNWEHHMQSYQKYTGSKQTGIFMVEYPEFALAMCEKAYCDGIDGMSTGDIREQEKFNEYRLSRDKEVLEYIYEFRNEIKYVIFSNWKRVEIIRTENIPYFINLLPWDYVVYPLQVATEASVCNISMHTDY